MAADLEKLAKAFVTLGYQDFGDFLGKQADVARERGVPEYFPVTELDLEAEWQRQSKGFVEFEFHRELGMEEQEYLESLPKFEPTPEEYKGRFDVPLLVETRISWEKQAELTGFIVTDYLKFRTTRKWHYVLQAPEAPYTGWFNRWGQGFVEEITPSDARKQLATDEVGAGPLEGIALRLAYPGITQTACFDLIGFIGSPGVPALSYLNGRFGLGVNLDHITSNLYRPLIRGSKIVTG